MAVDFSEPHKDQEYITLLASIRELAALISTLIDSREDPPDNIPTRAKRWNNSTKTFQEWTGAEWIDDVLSIPGGGTGAITASAARTALGVISSGEVDDKIAVHNAFTSPHSAVSTATPGRLLVRDASGRAKVVAPSVSTDIALLSNVTAHSNLTNPHSSTALPTVDRLVLRDGNGRAQVVAPSVGADIVTKTYSDAQDTATLAAAAVAAGVLVAASTGTFVTNANGNPNASDTVLDVHASLIISTWTTVGPTGGGCTVTWTALNSVPAGAEWIEVRGDIYFDMVGRTPMDSHYDQVYARNYTSTQTIGNDNLLVRCRGMVEPQGYVSGSSSYTAKIPVSSRRFYLYRYSSSTVNIHSSDLVLIGWGYNP